MKNLITIALIAAVSLLGSLTLSAADKVEKPVPAEKKDSGPPFHGKIAALDKTARTIKVGERIFHVTATTRIHMDGKPATFEDAKIGDDVGGQYRAVEGGKLEALSLRVGPKPEKKPKADKTK